MRQNVSLRTPPLPWILPRLFWKGFTVTHHEFMDAQTLRLQLEPDQEDPIFMQDQRLEAA